MTTSLACVLAASLLANPASPVPTPTPATADAGAGSWPQWRGPTRDGRSAGTTWPETLAAEHLTRKWHVGELGDSYSGPLVTESRVFTVGTVDESHEVVRAFDRATGKQVWETKWEGAMKVPFFARKNGSWIRSTPAFDGQRLYIGGIRDVLVCLDAATGDKVWEVDFKDRFGAALPSFGLVCSPLVTDSHVYLQAGASLVKLDKATGGTVWRALDDGGGMNSAFSSPIEATICGTTQIVVQSRTELIGVTPESGEVLWRQPIKAFRGMNILTPVVVGDAVFTATYGGRAQLLGLERTDAAFSVEQKWNDNTQGYMTSPVIIDGHAYLFTRSNRFACIRLADGERKWVSGPTGDDYWSLVCQGDRILALSNTGRLRLIRANPEAFEVLSEAEVSQEKTWAHLAVAGDDIVIREQEGLALFRWD